MLRSLHDRRVTLYAVIAAFGGFVFGLDIMNLSGAIRFVSSEFELNDTQIGLVGSSAIGGVIISLMFTGALCDWLGRRKVLLLIALAYSLSSILSATATNFEMLVIGRAIGGLAFASLTVSAMYIGEVAPKEKRGSFVAIQQLLIGLGLTIAPLVNYILLENMGTSSWITEGNIWRIMLGSELIANVIWVAALLIIPMSPRWLMMKERESEARNVLSKTLGEDKVDETLAEVRASLEQEGKHDLKDQFSKLFSLPMLPILCIAFAYAIAQGASGMNAVLAFLPIVFEQVGMDLSDSYKQPVYTGIISIIATIVSMVLVEKVGRPPLTLAGLAIVFLAHSMIWYGFNNARYELDEAAFEKIETVITAQNVSSEKQIDLAPLKEKIGTVYKSDIALKADLATIYDRSQIPLISGTVINGTISINASLVVVAIFLFLGGFNLTIGPIMWVVFSEIFASNVRGVAIPFVALIQSIAAVTIQQFFPWQLSNMGAAGTFLTYGIVAIAGLVTLAIILPETKGLTLEEIEERLLKKKSI